MTEKDPCNPKTHEAADSERSGATRSDDVAVAVRIQMFVIVEVGAKRQQTERRRDEPRLGVRGSGTSLVVYGQLVVGAGIHRIERCRERIHVSRHRPDAFDQESQAAVSMEGFGWRRKLHFSFESGAFRINQLSV